MRLFKFLWKYRRLSFAVTVLFALACPFYLLQGGEWWGLVIVALCVYVPFVLVLTMGAIQMERQVSRHVQSLAWQLLHNTTHYAGEVDEWLQDGAPTNHAWAVAMLRVRNEGHLHADLKARWNKSIDIISITWLEQ